MLVTLLGCALLAVVTGSCDSAIPTVERVQTNLVDKQIFEGEWWYTHTVLDADFDTSYLYATNGATRPFFGDMAWDTGVDYNRGGTRVLGRRTHSFPLGRIRWVIDEDLLVAYRTFELVRGGNDDGEDADYRGQPLAAWRIEAHVDVRRDYNPVTGERGNTLIEDTSDRRWFERAFMRVDWSENVLTDFHVSSARFNDFQRESVSLFFDEDSPQDIPKSWFPQFVRLGDEVDEVDNEDGDSEQVSSYRFYDEWPADTEQDLVHYMSFVTREIQSPGADCLVQGGGQCAAGKVTLRHSFLRVPPEHEYAASTQTHNEFDRFGLFRSAQPTYAGGGEDRSVLREYCERDRDCGPGGACDREQNICVGGLTGDFGQTDFLAFYRTRHNFYADSLTDRQCAQDWECDGRHNPCDPDDPECLTRDGSVCDPAARRCTVPPAERPVREVVYHLAPDFPPYLVRSAFRTVAEWNEALMKGQRAVTNRLPIDQYPCDERPGGVCTVDVRQDVRVDCQMDDPTSYCFCGSPEDQEGSCAYRYDPFQSPDAAEAAGVPNPYDCYVRGPEDIARPNAFEDYGPEEFYGYEFVGDECMLTLRANSCDVDPEQPCEQVGDIRYQFLVLNEQGLVGFDGAGRPLSDPQNGEVIVANANVTEEFLERAATQASQWLPVLRGEMPEDEYFVGEHVRGYFARLGRVEHPVSLAPTENEAFRSDGGDAPAAKIDRLRELTGRLQSMEDYFEQLRGSEGRARIFSDRLRLLAGTPIERRLMSSLGTDGRDAMVEAMGAQGLDMSRDIDDPEVLEQVSPFRDGGLWEQYRQDRQERRHWRSIAVDRLSKGLFNSQFWEYWANAFAGRSTAEAAMRLRQAMFRMAMRHELGHSLGLRHNFAASLDRNNYQDAYYPMARETPLPFHFDYDLSALGGNEDGQVFGEEALRWARDLRQARADRQAAGVGNVSSSSVMDYNGDLSAISGLGYYDHAAVLFNYFDKVDVFDSDPRVYPAGEPPPVAHGASLEGLHHSDRYRRDLLTYYRGGESCQVNADCPFTSGRQAVSRQRIRQRCVRNPRDSRSGLCGSNADNCVCSNFYDDLDDYVAARAYRTTRDPIEVFPTEYLYCNDNRTEDLSWCTANDAGETFQEIIENYRVRWEQAYPRIYFRNFRRGGPAKGAARDSIIDTAKIYQHLFFRFFFEDGFQSDIGPLGANDQLLASVDAMNWFAEIIGKPDVGSYVLDEGANVYRQVSEEPDDPDADFSLLPGQGFYLWSAYQEGLNGFFRLERAGTFLDKFFAIEALARRDWNLNFTVDERYFVNFYDLYPVEVTELFGGLIMRNPRWYAPRVTMDGGEPRVHYLNAYRGPEIQRESQAAAYPDPAVDGTPSEALRDWATIFALARFPVYYDTSFEQRLLIFKQGSGAGYELPETRPDGTPTCGYGEDACAEPDYIIYNSDRLHTPYVGVRINPDIGQQSVEQEQLGYLFLKDLYDRQQDLRALQDLASPTPEERDQILALRRNIERDESFMEYLIELSERFGITRFF